MQPQFWDSVKNFIWDHHREILSFAVGIVIGIILGQ
jgi:hypothetical protein